jgi:hypothetical protein
VAQAGSRRTHIAEGRVHSQDSPQAVCGRRSGSRTYSAPSTGGLPVSVMPPVFHTDICRSVSCHQCSILTFRLSHADAKQSWQLMAAQTITASDTIFAADGNFLRGPQAESLTNHNTDRAVQPGAKVIKWRPLSYS